MGDIKTNISNYLDSTYLNTSEELGLSKSKIKDIVISRVHQAINSGFACIMIRPEFVSTARKIIDSYNSHVSVGTVIDFPLGDKSTKHKSSEAQSAIDNGVDDIDFVCDYNAFKRGNFSKFEEDIFIGTEIGIKNGKIVKWIIETGALSKKEIRNISKSIVGLVQTNFSEDSKNVFIKTSTGYYSGFGATIRDVKIIKSVSGDLKIKASGGVSSLKDCYKMLEAGANRIGTSKAQFIYEEELNGF